MTDEQLLREFVKVESTDDAIVISIMQISWDGPHTPVSKWKKVRSLPATATEATIQHSLRQILEDQRYFRICPECSQRNPNGWMMAEYCQSCGERNHGIVF